MAIEQAAARIVRWSGGQHPTLSLISRQMQKDGLRPYFWEGAPNYRFAVRTNHHEKMMYVVEGMIEVMLPDSNQRVKLRAGDRVDIPSGLRHAIIVGSNGAKCVEAAIR
jgi:mannose-6-phosphate isomerase-like protein (cupin superfamily)